LFFLFFFYLFFWKKPIKATTIR